jgi:hypothetical protein
MKTKPPFFKESIKCFYNSKTFFKQKEQGYWRVKISESWV